jgi:excisionase family DNA binding protein
MRSKPGGPRGTGKRRERNREVAGLIGYATSASDAVDYHSTRADNLTDRDRQHNQMEMVLYTIDEVAKILHLKKTWLYERTRKNAIPFHRLGKYIRFTEADLQAIVAMGATPPTWAKDSAELT